MKWQRLGIAIAGTLAVTTVGLGTFFGVSSFPNPGSGTVTPPLAPDAKGNVIGSLNPCDPSVSPGSALGVIGRLAPGVSADQVGVVNGQAVRPLLRSANGSGATPGSANLVLLSGGLGEPAAASLAREASSRAALVAVGVGVVNVRSSDPAIKACTTDLSDNPNDVPLENAARDALVAGGYVDVATAHSANSSWFVSDDPLEPGNVIVTIAFTGAPSVRPALGAPKVVYGLDAAAAIINRATNNVVAAGLVDFYQ